MIKEPMADFNSHRMFLKKLFITLRDIRKTAYHHYGNSPVSLLKLIYYSALRINTFIIFEIDLAGELPIINLDPEYIVIKPSIQELNSIREGKNLPREFHYDEIFNVKKCYLACKEGNIASIHWVFTKYDYSRFFKLNDYVSELNYFTVLPEYRKNNLMVKMTSYICRDLVNEGYKKAVTAIYDINYPAIKCFDRAGFTRITTIKTVGPFNRTLTIS